MIRRGGAMLCYAKCLLGLKRQAPSRHSANGALSRATAYIAWRQYSLITKVYTCRLFKREEPLSPDNDFLGNGGGLGLCIHHRAYRASLQERSLDLGSLVSRHFWKVLNSLAVSVSRLRNDQYGVEWYVKP